MSEEDFEMWFNGVSKAIRQEVINLDDPCINCYGDCIGCIHRKLAKKMN